MSKTKWRNIHDKNSVLFARYSVFSDRVIIKLENGDKLFVYDSKELTEERVDITYDENQVQIKPSHIKGYLKKKGYTL